MTEKTPLWVTVGADIEFRKLQRLGRAFEMLSDEFHIRVKFKVDNLTDAKLFFKKEN